jgi:hypothetical protein
MNTLTLVIATRGRPDLLKYTIENTVAHISRERAGATKVLVCIDNDDVLTTRRLGEMPQADCILYSVKPREDSRGEKYDRALTECPADVYLPAVDCAPIVTPNWDAIILEKAALFPDGIGVIRTPYINGLFPPALQAVTAKFVKLNGYIYNPEYPFWFVDHEIHDLARLVGRYLLADVEVLTAATRPKTTIRMRDVAFWASYYDFMAIERRGKARKIIDLLDDAPHVKAHLRDCFHGIENEARSINEHVRQNAARIQAQRGDSGPPDEGYLRAKARAEQKLSRLIEAMKAAA